MNTSIKNSARVGFIFLLISSSLMAQNAPFATWSSILINSRIHTKWSNTTDIGYRTIGGDFLPFQNYIRTGLRHHFNQHVTALGGIAYFSTKTSFLPENNEYGREFRIYQEVQRQSNRNKKVIFDIRLRNEQRFFSKTSNRDQFVSFRLAGRAFVGYQFTNLFTWQVGSEYFESLTSKKLFMDQTRFMNQFIFRMNKGFSLNLMYMYVIRKAYNQSVFNCVLVKNINFNGVATPAR